MESVLSQADEVERFLKLDRDFISMRERFQFPGALVQPSSDFFSNRFIRSHFSFALSILKTIVG